MSSMKNKEILITFQELKHLEIDEIATCIDKYEALSICVKSSADPTEIFNIWAQKLLKAYDISKFQKSDWLQILDFLQKILNKFVHDLATLEDDKLLKQLHPWWTDTLELLKWLESIVNQIDVQILASILNFVLELIIKTCRVTDKRNIKPVITIHQKLLHFLTNHLLKTDIENAEEFNVCNRVLQSLCDVAALISATDIKVSIETWRSTAKLANKCNGYYKELDAEKRGNINQLKIDCAEKPIKGILNELKKLFTHFVEDDEALNNENFLKVAQFYLKLLKIIMQNSDSTFSVAKEYFELYAICMHQLKRKNERKVIDFLQKDFHGILHIINERTDIEECICEHLLSDNKLCESCDLILDYMQLYLGGDGKHIPSVATASRIFDIIFDGHLIFADNDKYSKVIEYYAALTAEDATSELHMKLCTNVLEYSWIKAYVSYEILVVFYRYYCKTDNGKQACLEFWINCWQKFNVTPSPQKILIEMVLQSIVAIKLPQDAMVQIFYKSQHPEILLLKCGLEILKLHSYLQRNLTKYLRKIHQTNIQRKEYIELVNLLDIWCCNSQVVNGFLVKDDLVKAFLKIFSMRLSEMPKFKIFFNRSFCILRKFKYNEVHNTILTCLQDNISKITAISSVYMLEYLLETFSQNQIKPLLPQELQKIQSFLEDMANKELDFKSLNDLYGKAIISNQNFALNATKRPRLDKDCNSTNCKYILNEMLDYSRQLSNASVKFDSTDYKLLTCIEENIQKCLLK